MGSPWPPVVTSTAMLMAPASALPRGGGFPPRAPLAEQDRRSARSPGPPKAPYLRSPGGWRPSYRFRPCPEGAQGTGPAAAGGPVSAAILAKPLYEGHLPCPRRKFTSGRHGASEQPVDLLTPDIGLVVFTDPGGGCARRNVVMWAAAWGGTHNKEEHLSPARPIRSATWPARATFSISSRRSPPASATQRRTGAAPHAR